ncbi:MAG: hypothetical protein AAFW00_25220 [Bacteroidota bacterium]
MNIYNTRGGLTYEMRGRYLELLENDKWRFFELHVIKYDPYQVSRLREMDCLEVSILGMYIDLIQESIGSETRYLYQLVTYLGKKDYQDAWEFNDHITDYQKFGFQDIQSVLTFCEENWGIVASDFKPQSETSIP